ncbi:MAG: GNAT family N-acetyltransferase [Gemmatimonadota bacterium]
MNDHQSLQVRPATADDSDALLSLWERSARASHNFLTEADIESLRPLVAVELAGNAIGWWVLVGDNSERAGFLGFANNAIEALFLDPEYQGRGGGTALVAIAEGLANAPLRVDVNEQNPAALRFYQKQGFEVAGRSATDDGGRPFPILHLVRASTYQIGMARPDEIPRLGEIEVAAAALLAGHAPAAVLAETTSPESLLAAQQRGHLWVARRSDVPSGFAHVEIIEAGSAHLAELDVHPDHGRRGIGRRLVRAVCDWAATSGCRAVTLTTFRDVPWNGPFYASIGFETLTAKELSPALGRVLQREAESGLDPARRVAMRWRNYPITP